MRVWLWFINRRFLVTDSMLLLFFTLVITTIEGRRLIDGVDPHYSLWKLIFEGVPVPLSSATMLY
jgi:hypothetical protein